MIIGSDYRNKKKNHIEMIKAMNRDIMIYIYIRSNVSENNIIHEMVTCRG